MGSSNGRSPTPPQDFSGWPAPAILGANDDLMDVDMASPLNSPIVQPTYEQVLAATAGRSVQVSTNQDDGASAFVHAGSADLTLEVASQDEGVPPSRWAGSQFQDGEALIVSEGMEVFQPGAQETPIVVDSPEVSYASHFFSPDPNFGNIGYPQAGYSEYADTRPPPIWGRTTPRQVSPDVGNPDATKVPLSLILNSSPEQDTAQQQVTAPKQLIHHTIHRTPGGWLLQEPVQLPLNQAIYVSSDSESDNDSEEDQGEDAEQEDAGTQDPPSPPANSSASSTDEDTEMEVDGLDVIQAYFDNGTDLAPSSPEFGPLSFSTEFVDHDSDDEMEDVPRDSDGNGLTEWGPADWMNTAENFEHTEGDSMYDGPPDLAWMNVVLPGEQTHGAEYESDSSELTEVDDETLRFMCPVKTDAQDARSEDPNDEEPEESDADSDADADAEGVDDDEVMPVDKILEEDEEGYLLQWPADPETGKKPKPTWEPHNHATAALVAEWEEKKRNRGRYTE
ncbi:hypothetical protein W97_05047 [Coniosporium apollinis CBS 100218]|uniref:Chromo domain-containing protein n=1 Tax=Coniosporium apollinis (strain CBS 100218) TaxID=1168221 RepID=R7YVD2_CONA1|nr:uncharacterized protein W97_05047 [Coniosporium apollinis CBS 100218]EON65808.1 hypothetical protein W97_05047 [Coniosporium apollinis CBS 100218]